MVNELVVTPGGYRPREMVYKIGSDLNLRILTGRLQGADASGVAVADYGSVPRDGSNPALTPGYALPPGVETPEGSEPGPSLGRGWIAFSHWRNDGAEAISSFRSVWRVPPEPETQSGQTIFLFLAMQDTIPMTLLPALQWGPSAAGGGEYWSVASWYIGGTTGAVFHGELSPVNVGDELTGLITLTGRRRDHFDYRCGFEGLGDADLPVHQVKQLSRAGVILAAYGVTQCSDYPASSATGFRGIEMLTGILHPPLAWNPANTVTDCGQHVVVLSDANPGGEVDIHYRPVEAEPAPEPVAAPIDAEVEPEPVMAEATVAAAAEAEIEAAEAVGAEPVAAEMEAMEPAADEGEAAPLVAATEAEAEAAPEPVTILVMEPETEPAAVAAAPIEPSPEPAARPQAGDAAAPPFRLEVNPEVGRVVEINIHNHAPVDPGAGTIEARLAALEATIASFAQLLRPEATPVGDDDVTMRLERLARLKGTGALSDDEFTALKAQLIGGSAESDGLDASEKAALR